eukprot:6772184-Prymnesium_polylepis.1
MRAPWRGISAWAVVREVGSGIAGECGTGGGPRVAPESWGGREPTMGCARAGAVHSKAGAWAVSPLMTDRWRLVSGR